MRNVQPPPTPELQTPELNLTRTEPSHIHIPRPSRLRKAALLEAEQAETLALNEAA